MGAPLDSKSNQPTLVTFLLDATQSMQSIKKSTLEAFNSYVNELKAGAAGIAFTLVTFNRNEIAKVHHEVPVQDVPELTAADYRPQSMTPLIEAATKTIRALEKAIEAKADKPKVVMCIQTDGEENCSEREYTWASLKALIAEKQKDGWQFNFMGAGIDAYDQAGKMGLGAAATMSYDHASPEATKSAFRASAQNTMLFASGARGNTSYGLDQKIAAGDAFDPDQVAGGPSPAPVVRNADVDLSTPDAPAAAKKKDELVL